MGESYQRYEGHLIRSGASRDPTWQRWLPRLTILWDKSANQAVPAELVHTEITFTKMFATEQEAQACAYRFAASWIDAGKPQLPTAD